MKLGKQDGARWASEKMGWGGWKGGRDWALLGVSREVAHLVSPLGGEGHVGPSLVN